MFEIAILTVQVNDRGGGSWEVWGWVVNSKQDPSGSHTLLFLSSFLAQTHHLSLLTIVQRRPIRDQALLHVVYIPSAQLPSAGREDMIGLLNESIGTKYKLLQQP